MNLCMCNFNDILDTYVYGDKPQIFYKNNFNWDEYFFDYKQINLDTNLIDEHFLFLKIKIITWSFVNHTVSRNGDLVCNSYIKINLPPITNFKLCNNIESTEKKEKDYNIINKDYKKLFIYSVDLLPTGIENFIFSNKMTELYIWSQYFETNLINLPKNLLLLSICSSSFDTNLTNLPDSLEYLYINSNCFDKNLTNLPIGLKVLSITTKNLNIKLDNLPQGLKILHINASIIKNYDMFSYLPESIEYLFIRYKNCNNLKNLNLFDLPIGLKILSITSESLPIELNNDILSNIFPNHKKKYITSEISTFSMIINLTQINL